MHLIGLIELLQAALEPQEHLFEGQELALRVGHGGSKLAHHLLQPLLTAHQAEHLRRCAPGRLLQLLQARPQTGARHTALDACVGHQARGGGHVLQAHPEGLCDRRRVLKCVAEAFNRGVGAVGRVDQNIHHAGGLIHLQAEPAQGVAHDVPEALKARPRGLGAADHPGQGPLHL